MQNIYPVCVDTCKPYIGRQVCAVLHDGSQVRGTIKGVSERGLEFEELYPTVGILSTKSRKGKKSGSKNAETSAYGPGYGYGYGYGGFGYPGAALAFTSIALLFLIPFFFI